MSDCLKSTDPRDVEIARLQRMLSSTQGELRDAEASIEAALRTAGRLSLLDMANACKQNQLLADAAHTFSKEDAKRLPDAEGWWARRTGSRISWFFVYKLDDAPFSVWLDEVEDFVTVSKLTRPLTRWVGPVTLPWSENL